MPTRLDIRLKIVEKFSKKFFLSMNRNEYHQMPFLHLFYPYCINLLSYNDNDSFEIIFLGLTDFVKSYCYFISQQI